MVWCDTVIPYDAMQYHKIHFITTLLARFYHHLYVLSNVEVCIDVFDQGIYARFFDIFFLVIGNPASEIAPSLTRDALRRGARPLSPDRLKLWLKLGLKVFEEIATARGYLSAEFCAIEGCGNGGGLGVEDQPCQGHGQALLVVPRSCWWRACDVGAEDLFQLVGWDVNVVLWYLC